MRESSLNPHIWPVFIPNGPFKLLVVYSKTLLQSANLTDTNNSKTNTFDQTNRELREKYGLLADLLFKKNEKNIL